MDPLNCVESASILLSTERLVLRTVSLADEAQVAASWKLDEGPISLAEARAVIERMQLRHAQNRAGRVVHVCLAIRVRGAAEICGWCGLDHTNPSWPNPVLFDLLRQRVWGKGLATEAARALLAYGFGTLGLERIDAAAAADHLASQRVLEKLGMQRLGQDAAGGQAFTLGRAQFAGAGTPAGRREETAR